MIGHQKNIHLEDPFSMDVTNLTVGYVPDADMEVVEVLKMDKQNIDALVGNARDWEWVWTGNLVGMPAMVLPTGLKDVQDPPANGTRRRTAITTGTSIPR